MAQLINLPVNMSDNLPNLDVLATTPASDKEFIKDGFGPVVKWKQITHTTGPTPLPRHGHRAVAIKDLMLVFGGGNDGIIDQLHVYNTVTNQWFLPAVRGDIPQGCAAYGIACDMFRIFIFGGMVEYGRYSNDLFELQTRRWEWRRIRARQPRSGHPGPCPRLGHSFTMSESDHICYVFGGLATELNENGHNMPRYMNDLYTIDMKPTTTHFQWECPTTFGSPPSPRESHSAVYYESGLKKQLIIFGGMVGTRLGDLWILDLYSMSWSNPELYGIPPLPRSLHTANIVNNRMYVFGGWVPVSIGESFDSMEKDWQCTNSLGIFNVETLTWEYLSETTMEESETVPRPRAGHSSVVINKRIYIWSGRDGYRKMEENHGNPQMCCKDMYYLETDVPAPPGPIQLVRASINGLELSWPSVPTANKYLLQLQKYVPEPVQQAPQRNFVRSATSMKMIPIQRNGTQQVMKLIRHSNPNSGRPPQQQVLRVMPANKAGLVGSAGGGGAASGGIKVPIQKTIIVSKAAAALHSQQPPQQFPTAPTTMHHGPMPLGGLNNGNTGGVEAAATQKLVFVQPSLQQQQAHMSQQQQIPQQNLPPHHQQISYSSDGHLHQSYGDVHDPNLSQQSYENPHLQTAQTSSLSQQQFSGRSTTYSTPIVSSIDQSMPHDILDEALNDAENYEVSSDAQNVANISAPNMEQGDQEPNMAQGDQEPNMEQAEQEPAPTTPEENPTQAEENLKEADLKEAEAKLDVEPKPENDASEFSEQTSVDVAKNSSSDEPIKKEEDVKTEEDEVKTEPSPQKTQDLLQAAMAEIDIPFPPSSCKPSEDGGSRCSLEDSTISNFPDTKSYQNLYESSASSSVEDTQQQQQPNFVVSTPSFAQENQQQPPPQNTTQEGEEEPNSSLSEEPPQKFFDDMSQQQQRYSSPYNTNGSSNVETSSFADYNSSRAQPEEGDAKMLLERSATGGYPSTTNNDDHPLRAIDSKRQSPTALQDPSTISLHSTELEAQQSTPSPLPAPTAHPMEAEELPPKQPKLVAQQPIKLVQRLEPSPPQQQQQYQQRPPRDLWYDVGVFDENKCFVTHFTLPTNATVVMANQEIGSESFDQIVKKVELEPGTIYKFRVAGLNDCGQGGWSPVIGFKTCLPGFPGAPSSIKISKNQDGAQLTWEPPQNSNGRIVEYSVYLAVRNYNQDPQCAFVRVYAGFEPKCIVTHLNLQQAYIDNSPKPAIIFRIAAKNEKGYGPATQVRWLQDSRPINTTPIHHATMPVRRPVPVEMYRMANVPNQQTSNYIAKRMRLE